jgi:hypothetical protein
MSQVIAIHGTSSSATITPFQAAECFPLRSLLILIAMATARLITSLPQVLTSSIQAMVLEESFTQTGVILHSSTRNSLPQDGLTALRM